MPKYVCRVQLTMSQKAKSYKDAKRATIEALYEIDNRDVLAPRLEEEVRCEVI